MCHCQLFPYYDDTLPPASSSLAALCMPLRLRRHDKPVHEPAASGGGEGEDTMHTNPQTSSPETERLSANIARDPEGIRRALYLLGDKFFFRQINPGGNVSFRVRLRYFSSPYAVGWVNNEIAGYLNSLDLRSEGKSNNLYFQLQMN